MYSPVSASGLSVPFLFLIALLSNPGTNGLDCYVCNNGYKSMPACEKGPPTITSEVLLKTFDPAKNECKSLDEFFTKHAFVNTEWLKRHSQSGGKSKGRAHSSAEIEQHCVSVMMEGHHSKIWQVYRDCVQGRSDEIEKRIKDVFDLGINLHDTTLSTDHCKLEKVGTTIGTKRVQICLCETNKCNDKPASEGCVIKFHLEVNFIGLLILYLVYKFVTV